ncbi:MAG: hypothetical protein Tp1125DCM238401_15 [Prokaryotic dsDNA virus sp.]|nr:MAG: hypothetical protein Tp1125DCM238401_15 [Prokaryotic dsDNA virus sp.]|tara:strand:+ start:315 stop:503 length:189 start_codon:yes stop_codon:yes gene_type:complete
MKPGYKTTEFWLAGAATVVGGLMASGVIAEESSLAKILGIAASALVALGYTGARLALKKKAG